MKKRLFLIVTMLSLILTACSEFQLNEHMLEASFMAHGGNWNKKDNTTRRVWLTLMVKGINEDPYTLEYTIDGKQGVNEFALQKVDEETAVLVYNNQAFEGSEYMSEVMFSGEYNGNFTSGSTTTLRFLNTQSNTHPNHGSATFLSPKLEAGKHTLAFTLTNSYGEKITSTKEFTIQAKPEN